MQYGLVQVLNAALTLVNDEDFHIRQKSVRFVGQLELNRDGADDNKVEDRGRIGKIHAWKVVLKVDWWFIWIHTYIESHRDDK